MTDNSKYPRGSEWRKWDLHVHTPNTQKNDCFRTTDKSKDVWGLFCENIENSDVDVIGITDYFSVANYFIFLTKFKKMYPNSTKIFFPNIEICTSDVVNKASEEVNMHLIFDLKISQKQIREFLINLKTNKTDAKGRNIKAFELESKKEFEEATTTRAFIKEAFKETFGDKAKILDYFLIFTAINNDGARPVRGKKRKEIISDEIDKFSHGFFGGSQNTEYFLKTGRLESEDEIAPKPVICGSDVHSFEDMDNWLGKEFINQNGEKVKEISWIKADPTFEGLKQILYEPEDRAYIGREPSVIERVRNNKTKYIDTLNIDQKSGYNGKQGIWFKNVNIGFNKELVAIIGNKGSGKSAMSDTLGLLGHTHNAGEKQENLTFLNGKILKFRKRGYAENFEAELLWEDGSGLGVNVPLNKDIDINKKEKVKYIPQNYFESLTNELDGIGFDKTLKSVTFLHIPEEERLGLGTFEELEKEKIKNIEFDLVDFREQTHIISDEIIKLEVKQHPDYIKKLHNLIDEKQKELDEHEKNKPARVKDPSKGKTKKKDEIKEKQYKQLKKLNSRHDAISQNIDRNRDDLNLLTQEKEELTQIHDEINRFDVQISNYKSQNKDRFTKYGLDIEKVIEVKFDCNALKLKIDERENKITELNKTLFSKDSIDDDDILNKEEKEKAYELSYLIQQERLQKKIDKIKNDLSKRERVFQEYKENIRKWELQKKEINGSDKTPNTLKFHEAEEKFIQEKLPKKLDETKEKRIKKTIEIFEKKKEIIDLYNKFKGAIDKQIRKETVFAEKFKMEINADFRLKPSFTMDFLRYINKTKSGTFRGAEDKKVNEIFAEVDLLNHENIIEILNTIIFYLQEDQRPEVKETDKKREISDQIEKIQEFYDFIFSLDYLKPIYELKLDDKNLDELSPGEKGALLLVFYLMIDKEDIPLIIDQPEDNLDNKSVFLILRDFIKSAKKRRQIIIVTHNPNLAVCADAEQIIYVKLDKKNEYKFNYELGSIENPKINKRIVEILEGTMPAFDKRKLKYLTK